MNSWITAAAIAATLGGLPAMAATIFPYPVQREVLPNGLTVIMIPMESGGLVSYYSVVRTGSRDEVEPGKSGFAHFFEHMMFRGTKNFPGPVYDSLMTSIGADANASTTDDLTQYHVNFAREDLELVIKLEADRFQNLSYDKAVFQTEAGAVYGEYRKNITSPWMMLNEKVQDLAYDVHTYKHTTMGFEADVKAMPEQYEYSLSFFHRFYRPENVVLVIAGDIDPQRTLGLVKKYYGPWQKGYVPPAVVQEPPQKGERTGEVSYGGRTLPILNLAYKGDAFDPANRRYLAAMIFADLAFGETSDLYGKLYIKEQRVQSLDASVPRNRDVPLFEITAMVKNVDDIAAVRAEIEATIAKFQQEPVDQKRLEDLKRRTKYGFLMSLDTPARVAGGLSRWVALTGGVDVVDEFYANLEKVTTEDVLNAARYYYTQDRRTVVVLKGAAQ